MSTTREDEELERELAELEREDQHEYYTLLNVDLKATQEEIRSAYRRLCRVYHPDRYVAPFNGSCKERSLAVLNTVLLYHKICSSSGHPSLSIQTSRPQEAAKC